VPKISFSQRPRPQRTLRFGTFLVIIDDPFDPLFEHNDVKINQESNLQAQEAEVRKHLGMVNRMERFLGFDFHNDSAIDYDAGLFLSVQKPGKSRTQTPKDLGPVSGGS